MRSKLSCAVTSREMTPVLTLLNLNTKNHHLEVALNLLPRSVCGCAITPYNSFDETGSLTPYLRRRRFCVSDFCLDKQFCCTKFFYFLYQPKEQVILSILCSVDFGFTITSSILLFGHFFLLPSKSNLHSSIT